MDHVIHYKDGVGVVGSTSFATQEEQDAFVPTQLLTDLFNASELAQLEQIAAQEEAKEAEARQERARAAARADRAERLSATDWTQLPDVLAQMPEDTRNAWVSYRQALRDVPTQPGFPDNITWPVLPA